MDIRVTTFEEAETDIRTVRDIVFGGEQKVAPKLDWDGKDPGCIHVVAANGGGGPVGTGRIQPDGKIGRLAVLKQWRSCGVGGGMLEMLIESARRQGLGKVYLHAQVHALAFYEKKGFVKTGDCFIEADILHVRMDRDIG